MSTRSTLLVAQGSFADLDDLRQRFGDRADIDEIDIGQTADDLAAALDGRTADGLAVALQPLRQEHFAVLTGTVSVVGRAGIGLDSIDLDAAAQHGVAVVHQPEYATAEVATQAVALILAAQRRVVEADNLARTSWGARHEIGNIAALDEATVAVIGCGRIGRAVIDRLRPLVESIVAYDPYSNDLPTDVSHAETLDDALRQANILTLHLPLTAETEGLIAAPQLATMPAGSIVVNVSRGGLVDEADLSQALHSLHISGAGLDVLATEPPMADNPILTAPNVTLSPHLAWYSTSSEQRLKNQTIADMLAYVKGGPITGRLVVDPMDPSLRKLRQA